MKIKLVSLSACIIALTTPSLSTAMDGAKKPVSAIGAVASGTRSLAGDFVKSFIWPSYNPRASNNSGQSLDFQDMNSVRRQRAGNNSNAPAQNGPVTPIELVPFLPAIRTAAGGAVLAAAGLTQATVQMGTGAVLNGGTRAVRDMLAPNGQGKQALDDLVKMLGDQIRNDGQGKKAFEDFVKLLGDQMRGEGQGKKALEDGIKLLGDQMRPGGAGTSAIQDGLKTLGELFVEGGEGSNAMRQGVAEFNHNLRELADEGLSVGEDFQDLAIEGLKRSAFVTVGATAAIITIFYGSRFAWKIIERNYKTPSIFVATSEKTVYEKLRDFVRKPKAAVLPRMVASREKQADLNRIIDTTRSINARIRAGDPYLKYRNVLLWGPPGTGKTMFAENLARASGMEFRIMSGADVSKMAKVSDALQALDEVFNFAQRSKKGLLLFIDEADSFLGDRSQLSTDNGNRKLVDKFLNYTGGGSNKFMLVLATNHKNSLDSAIKDRIGESIKMDLPNQVERAGILCLYRDKYLLDPKHNSAEFIASVNEHFNIEKIKQLSGELEGLSGRNLESIINSLKADASITLDNVLSPGLINDVIKRALKKHKDLRKEQAKIMVKAATGNPVTA